MVPAINLLAPEILSEILQRVVHGRKALCRQHVRFLSHVDRHWRSVALNTPQLWTTIVTSHPFKATSDPEYITDWVERAKALPVTFVLRGLKSNSIKAIVNVIKTIGPSIDTVYFDGGHCWPLDGAFKDVTPGSFSFPRLRRFKCRSLAPLHIIERHFLHAMPMLEQVSLDVGSFCTLRMLRPFFPWLTHFQATSSDVETITELFLHARFLRYCRVSTSETSLNLPQPFRHDTLRSLYISSWQENPLVLSQWVPSFPNLKHLTMFVVHLERFSDDGTPAVPLLLRPSSAGLQYLDLLLSNVTVDQFAQCLTHMPDVRFLHLYGGVSEGYINALIYDPESNFLLVPRLEVLSISGIEFKAKVLWDFALSRAHTLEHGLGDEFVHPLSKLPTLDLSSKLSAMQLRNPQPCGTLWYIKLTRGEGINFLRSRFAPMVSRMQRALGITLKIAGGPHHSPRRDAMDLLGLGVGDDSDWDWRGTVF